MSQPLHCCVQDAELLKYVKYVQHDWQTEASKHKAAGCVCFYVSDASITEAARVQRRLQMMREGREQNQVFNQGPHF